MDKLSDCSAKMPPLDRARLSHAYIISAPASESEELAVQLAALMLCHASPPPVSARRSAGLAHAPRR